MDRFALGYQDRVASGGPARHALKRSERKNMTRNLKVLGLALMAVFALSAVAASAASAEGVITSDGSVTLKGTEIAAGPNKLEAFGATVECPGSTYTGHKINVTPHELIPNGANAVTINPTYINCHEGSNPITVDMNGCDYGFHGATRVSTGTYSILADVVCPTGASIEVTGGFCTVKIGAQTNKAGFHLTDTGSGTSNDLDLTGSITTLHATACGGLLSTNEAKESNNVTIKGFNGAGTETGVTVSG
jgi:hypothetical protein